MATPKKASVPKKAAGAKAKPPAPPPFTTTDREVAFQHFAPLVKDTPEAALEHWHYDGEIVRVNTARCLEALAPHLDAIGAKMPHVDVGEIRELPALGLALAFADARVFVPASEKQIQEVQSRQRPRRKLALMQLLIHKEMKLLKDSSKVDAIVPGRGGIDEAQDGVACAAVLRENAAAIAGKHPFDEAWLAALADDSNWLLAQLKPKGAKVGKAEKSADVLVRDQLFAETVRRYGQAKKVAVEVWGWKRVDEHFPALLSREVSRSSDTAAAGAAAGVVAETAPQPA